MIHFERKSNIISNFVIFCLSALPEKVFVVIKKNFFYLSSILLVFKSGRFDAKSEKSCHPNWINIDWPQSELKWLLDTKKWTKMDDNCDGYLMTKRELVDGIKLRDSLIMALLSHWWWDGKKSCE